MIYTENHLIEKVIQMIENFEDEVVEFKEAKTKYSFKDIGKYFSALGNEANIRDRKEAWLIFGVTNKKKLLEQNTEKMEACKRLKKEIVIGTNERLTFMEIYELELEESE